MGQLCLHIALQGALEDASLFVMRVVLMLLDLDALIVLVEVIVESRRAVVGNLIRRFRGHGEMWLACLLACNAGVAIPNVSFFRRGHSRIKYGLCGFSELQASRLPAIHTACVTPYLQVPGNKITEVGHAAGGDAGEAPMGEREKPTIWN
jgi:hypothetical protein